MPVASGHTLADRDALTAGWKLADVVALREFLEGRGAQVFAMCMKEVAKVRRNLRSSENPIVRLNVTLHEAGVGLDDVE